MVRRGVFGCRPMQQHHPFGRPPLLPYEAPLVRWSGNDILRTARGPKQVDDLRVNHLQVSQTAARRAARHGPRACMPRLLERLLGRKSSSRLDLDDGLA